MGTEHVSFGKRILGTSSLKRKMDPITLRAKTWRRSERRWGSGGRMANREPYKAEILRQ